MKRTVFVMKLVGTPIAISLQLKRNKKEPISAYAHA